MTNFFTGKGDEGTTGLLGEGRVRKDAPRLEAIGTIDEANSILGMARATCRTSESGNILLIVQRDLYNMMAEVSATPENASKFRKIDSNRVTWLEGRIESISSHVEPINDFIVPGDTYIGAVLDLARSVVRRAERRLTTLYLDSDLENHELLRYLNRLSSLCFVLALMENQHSGQDGPTLAKE